MNLSTRDILNRFAVLIVLVIIGTILGQISTALTVGEFIILLLLIGVWFSVTD